MTTIHYRRVGFTLFALFFASVLAFLDRQLLNILVDPIKASVGIDDVQFSLLQGAAFALVYCLAAFPIAHLSDRYNRKLILLLSVGAWSLMTLMFGLAGSFGMLLIARMGVALGEAGLSPAAISIVRQIYPASRQTLAIALLTISAYVGGGISMAIGGPALSMLEAQGATLPFGLEPWRLIFIACASLGLVGMAFLWMVPEPERETRDLKNASFRAFVAAVRRERIRVAAYLAAATGLNALVFSVMSWTPALFMRVHGWDTGHVGLVYGAIYMAGGIVGALVSGKLVGLVLDRGQSNAIVTVLRGATLLLGGGTALAALASNASLAMGFVAIGMVGIGAIVTLGAYGFQTLFDAVFSARAVALNFLIPGTLGASLGPTAVPMLARMLGGEHQLAPALALVACLAIVWAGICFTIFLRASPAAANGEPFAAE